jgi:hypothetical protein
MMGRRDKRRLNRLGRAVESAENALRLAREERLPEAALAEQLRDRLYLRLSAESRGRSERVARERPASVEADLPVDD